MIIRAHFTPHHYTFDAFLNQSSVLGPIDKSCNNVFLAQSSTFITLRVVSAVIEHQQFFSMIPQHPEMATYQIIPQTLVEG